MKKQTEGGVASWKKIWTDPVWSKVIATGIVALGGLLWVTIQSFAQKISLADSLNRVLGFLRTATPVNNTVLIVAAMVLLWLVIRTVRGIRRGPIASQGVSEFPAASDAPALNPALFNLHPTAPQQILERLGSQPGDRSIMNAFLAVKGQPNIKTRLDGHYGTVVEVEINMLDDQWDYNTIAGREAQQITIVARPLTGFIFYLKVAVTSKTGDAQPSRWIALRADISSISKGIDEIEKAYPASWTPDAGYWMRISYSIPRLVDDCFGQEGWRYHQLLALRVRGKGVLASVTLS